MRCSPGAADCCGGGKGVSSGPEYLADRLKPNAPDGGEGVNRQYGSPGRAMTSQLGHHRLRPLRLRGTYRGLHDTCYNQRIGLATSNELVWTTTSCSKRSSPSAARSTRVCCSAARPLPAIASCLAGIDPQVLAELRQHHTQQAGRKRAAGPAWRDHGLILATETSAGAGSETEFSQRSRWPGRLTSAIRTEAQCA